MTLAAAARYVEALLAGDRNAVRAALHEEFGRHRGRGLEAHLDFEIAECARRAERHGLSRGHGVTPLPAPPGLFGFAVSGPRGEFVFEDALALRDGRLAGDGAAFEAVSKLEFLPERTERGLAVRRDPHPPALVVLHDPRVVDSLAAQDDFDPEFATFRFLLADDDGKGFLGRVGIHARPPGRPERRAILMRGRDHPFFRDAIRPQIRGGTVRVDGRGSVPRSLNVFLADGRRAAVGNPEDGEHRFDAPVTAAILTDALDNDWHAVPPEA